jgi:hypothetical protein
MWGNFHGAIGRRAKEIDYPAEAVLPMAIAKCLCKSIMECSKSITQFT